MQVFFNPATDCSKENLVNTNKEPLSAQPHNNAASNGVAAELSDEGIRNLTGFFDVLIQMDFAQKQRNERNDEDGNDLQNTSSVAA